MWAFFGYVAVKYLRRRTFTRQHFWTQWQRLMLLLWRVQQQPITSFVCVCYQTKTRKPTSGRMAYKGLFSVFFANVVFVAVIFWWLFRLFFCLLFFFSGLVTKFLAISDKNIPIYTYLRICTYIYGNWMWLCMCVWVNVSLRLCMCEQSCCICS